VTADETQRHQRRLFGTLVAGLVALAFLIRFCHLGDWNFQATEIFTLRDSLRPRLGNPRPLGYLLNYYLVRPFHPLDELGLRLLPAFFGALAIPVFFFQARRLIPLRAAFLGTLLLTVSPLQLLYSQLARYWSLVFLLSAVYPYALYLAIRDRSRRALALGIVTGILAVLAHPAAVLLAGGLAIWFLATYLQPGQLKQLWSQRSVRWATAFAVILAAVIAIRFFPILHGWISEHDKNPASGQFLIRPPAPRGVKQLIYLLAFGESLTVPLVLSAAAGIYFLWQGRDRSLALLLTSVAIFPIAFLTLISLRTPVSTYYLLPVVPVFFLAAGVFLDRLFEVDGMLRPHWLLPAVVTAMIVAAGVPTLVSDLRDGRRFDFRSAAHWLHGALTPGDVVFSDQPMVLAHYLPDAPVHRLRPDPVPLRASLDTLRASGHRNALWIVAPAPSHAFRANLKQRGLIRWIYDNCQLRTSTGVGRVDYRQEYLHVYRCPPMSPDGAGSSGAAATP
jgi:Dolichyl-phosphate-mannose-protein mannosyltransferase